MRRRLAGLLLAVLCLGLCACSEAADESESAARPETPAAARSTDPLPEQSTAPLPEQTRANRHPNYPQVRVYADGLLIDRGYQVGDTVYLSPETVCAFFGEELTQEESDEQVTLSAQGLEMVMKDGLEYITANDRYLYTPDGFFITGGRVYLPADAVERALGIHVRDGEEPMQVELWGEGLNFIQGGENYYAYTYSMDDLYWLTHIIYGESAFEPLAGMIGVGNVVLNRVANPAYPDTIYDVVYDKNDYVVQFDPIATGGVLAEPSERAYIAAYLVLEGYNTVGDSQFFVNPRIGIDAWFRANLEPTVSIGLHDFYRFPDNWNRG